MPSLLFYLEVTKIKKEDLEALTLFSGNIKEWVLKLLPKLPYDKTVRANVTEILTNNQYKISMLGREFIVISTETYNIHDTMRVLIEQNDLKRLYVLPKN